MPLLFVLLSFVFWLISDVGVAEAIVALWPSLATDMEAFIAALTIPLSILAALMCVGLIRLHDEQRDKLKAAQSFLRYHGGLAVNEAMRWKAEEVARLFAAAESIRHKNARVSGSLAGQEDLVQAQQAFEKAHAEFRQFQDVLNEANILNHATVEDYLNWPSGVPLQREESIQASPSEAVSVAQT